MRKIIGVAVSCLVLCSLFLIAQPAFGALTSPLVWTPDYDDNEEEYKALSVDLTALVDVEFGIYDYNNASNVLTIFPNSLTPGSVVDLEFTQDSDSNWIVSFSNDSTKYLNLGTTYEFGFYFDDGSGRTDNYSIVPDPFLEEHDPLTQTHTLSWVYNYEEDGEAKSVVKSVVVNDVLVSVTTNTPTVVPIPTAMILFGSGLVGLAGFKRKMDN